MAFTYSPQLLTARDRVRHAVGDTDPAAPLREDATIDAFLVIAGEDGAVAALAEGLAAEFARKPDSIGSDGSSISWRERVKTWLAVAQQARAGGADGGGAAGSFVAGRDGDAASEYRRPKAGAWWTG